MQKLCPSQFCNPTAEPFHGFHNNRSGSDEQETTELCCQQDQELRPLPAVQRISPQPKIYIIGSARMKADRFSVHRSIKARNALTSTRGGRRTFTMNLIIDTAFLCSVYRRFCAPSTMPDSMYPTAGAVGQGQRSASRERICLPMEINSSNRVRKSSRSAA